MLKSLYPDFLTDMDQYNKAVQYWKDLWGNASSHPPQFQGWRSPWINTIFEDGTPMQDGNPIFSAICQTKQRGLRVIQFEPDDTTTNFHYSLAVSGSGDITDPEAITELVIACALTDANALLAQLLMNSWISGSLNYKAVDNALTPAVGPLLHLTRCA